MAASQPLAAGAADREGWDMAIEPGPRVLLGNLGPIMRLGMNRVLSEEGCQVVGQEDRPSAIIGAAHGCAPTSWCSISTTAPRTSWPGSCAAPPPRPPSCSGAREEDLMEVLEPVSSTSRLVAAPIVERLRGELSGQHVHE